MASSHGLEGVGSGQGAQIRGPWRKGEDLEIHGPSQGSQLRFQVRAQGKDPRPSYR